MLIYNIQICELSNNTYKDTKSYYIFDRKEKKEYKKKVRKKIRYINRFVIAKNIINLRDFFKYTTNNRDLNKSNKNIYILAIPEERLYIS